jgi:hypothetical protein
MICKLIATAAVAALQVLVVAPAVAAQEASVPRFSATLVGRVEDQEGRPVADATVSVLANGAWPRVTSDVQGRFRYPVPWAGRYSVWAAKERDLYPVPYASLYGAGGSGSTVVDVQEQGDVDVGVVRLAPRAGKLVLNLVAADTGEPLDGLEFELCRIDRPDACMGGGHSLEGGMWSVLIPSAPVTLRVQADGFEPCFISEDGAVDKEVALGVDAGTTTSLVVRLQRSRPGENAPN